MKGDSMYSEDKEKKEKKTSQNNISMFFRKRTKRLLTDIDKLFNKIMWYQIILSVILVILGLVFLIWTAASLKVIGVLFGIQTIAIGIGLIYSYTKRREIPLFRYNIFYGILGILLGIVTILSPFLFTQVITIFIGIWILYMAIMKIDFAIRLKKMKEESWLLILVTAILEIFMSILIFINPFSNLLLTQVAGAYFILCGVLNATDAILTKNRAIDFLEKL